MQYDFNKRNLAELLSSIDAPRIIPTIEEGLKIDRLELDAYRILNDKEKIRELRDRIVEAEVLLCLLYVRKPDR